MVNKRQFSWKELFKGFKLLLYRNFIGIAIFVVGLTLVGYMVITNGKDMQEAAYGFWVDIGIGISLTGIIIAYSTNDYLAKKEQEEEQKQVIKDIVEKQIAFQNDLNIKHQELLQQLTTQEATLTQLTAMIAAQHEKAEAPALKTNQPDQTLRENYVPISNI